MTAAPVPVVDLAVRQAFGAAPSAFVLDAAFRADAPVTLLTGPSGAGKSLTLRAIAGLHHPDAGRIRVLGETVFDAAAGVHVPARRRGVGYVFQHYALFPHLSVRDNVGFALRRGWRGWRAEDRRFVGELLERLELASLAAQPPARLSGGQQQRVALARALAARPRLLLLDEPFAALDAALRARLRGELLALARDAGFAMVVVTHDAEDLAQMPGARVEMAGGRVVAVHPAGASGAA